MSNGLVSCIITTYKREVSILRRAIDSVLNQTYMDIELIVVNDCPEERKLCEEILQLIQSYSQDITYIVQPRNMGACKARNTGIEAAKGEFIALLDDDDEWLPNKIEEQINLFTDENVGLVYCDSIIMRQGKKTIHHCVPKLKNSGIIEALLYQNFIGGNSFPLLRKIAVQEAGMYDIEMKALQDVDMWVRIAQRYLCVYCAKPLVINHISDVSITTISSNRISGFRRMMEKYDSLYKEHPSTYHERLLGITGELLAAGRLTEAWEFYKKAVNFKPLSARNILVPGKSIILKIRRIVLKY
ncbi:MAG: glycosyltransferase family 2 protein [Coprococcus sp.]